LMADSVTDFSFSVSLTYNWEIKYFVQSKLELD